ncbi:hypothetical protein BDW62DRAFT_54360 [Aspergillus aurantiobrunneus]
MDSDSEELSATSSMSQETTPAAPQQLNQHHRPRANPKPTLVLICPSGKRAVSARYRSILTKMDRDAHLLYAVTLADLYRIMANEIIFESIAGFVVTDARIMGVDTTININTDADADIDDDADANGGDGEMVALSKVLAGILTGAYFYVNEPTHPHDPRVLPDAHVYANPYLDRTGNRGMLPGWRNMNPLPPNPREWTVVFAFDFPFQAARYPLRFGKYMAETFGVGWRICGATKGKCALEMSEKGLRKMGGRVYRGDKYKLRAVFLESVDDQDKVLVVAKGASVENGGLGSQGQPDVDNQDNDAGGWYGGIGHGQGASRARVSGAETESTAGEEGEFDIAQVEVGDEGVGWTVAPEADDSDSPSWADGEYIDMIELESRREEHDWADDELTADEEFGGPDAKDDDDASTSSNDSEKHRNQRVIYVNVPDQRGNHSHNVDSDGNTAAQAQRKKRKTHKLPKRIADCPVTIHEVKSLPARRDESGELVSVRGYVGFVGHVEDNRSMASLILGMCAVRNTTPLPESMQAYLRDRQLG